MSGEPTSRASLSGLMSTSCASGSSRSLRYAAFTDTVSYGLEAPPSTWETTNGTATTARPAATTSGFCATKSTNPPRPRSGRENPLHYRWRPVMSAGAVARATASGWQA
uniref:Uncharacterized protein n=1 Tax=Aegilops tauschii subsp. strangulata TaxID=200361 RepID=A0A453GCJ1_AEGTS